MPSTLVHVGFAGLLGTALLADTFDTRAILVVLGVTVIPDLDTFVGLWILPGAHRAALHNLVIPGILLGILVWDVHGRTNSFVLRHWGTAGYRVAWVSLLGGWIVAGVLFDAFYNGVNLFWPLYDQFIDLSGSFAVSDRQGVLFTFLEFDVTGNGLALADGHARGTTADMHYYTGVDPGPGQPADAERWFPIAATGERFLLMISGFAAVAYRIARFDDGLES